MFEVTERGRPVARLVPLAAAPNDVIARLAAEGRIARVATADLAKLPPPEPAPPGAISISEALQEIREDRI